MTLPFLQGEVHVVDDELVVLSNAAAKLVGLCRIFGIQSAPADEFIIRTYRFLLLRTGECQLFSSLCIDR